MLRFLLFTSLLPHAYGAVGGLVGRTQAAGARGILTCNGRPESGVLIKLYDDDRGTVLINSNKITNQQRACPCHLLNRILHKLIGSISTYRLGYFTVP